jgi:TetR/AcrR family transcriptional repressor of nem operon
MDDPYGENLCLAAGLRRAALREFLTDRSIIGTFTFMVGRPKEFDPDAALDAAVDLFWSKGFEGCSMAELLDHMQINRQSLYDTYGDKRELFMAVLAKYMSRVGAEMHGALSNGKTPLAKIRNFLKLVAKKLASGSAHGCLLTNTMVELGPHDAEIREAVAARWRGLEDTLANLFQQAVDEREIRSTANPRQLARLVFTVMQGSIVLSKAGMKDSVKDAIKSVEKIIRGME